MKPGVVSAAVAALLIVGSVTAEAAKAPPQRDCAPNFVMKGNFFTGRNVTAFKVYPNGKKGAAVDSIVPAIALAGYGIDSSSAAHGVITARQGPVKLNVVVAPSGKGIKVDVIMTIPGDVIVQVNGVLDDVCKIFNAVH